MAPATINCRLHYHSLSAHLQQLYAGFAMLNRRGIIRLTQQFRQQKPGYASDAPHLVAADHAHLSVVVNDRVRVHFDTHDAMELATDEAEACDLYFKRSYSTDYVGSLPTRIRDKIFPLGLNYKVLSDLVDWHAFGRALLGRNSARDRMATLKQALDVKNMFGFQPRFGAMAAGPEFDAAPKVLFLTAAYDPYDDPNRSQDKIEDRRSINETRANCIRLLRSELGPQFMGGLVQNQYAAKEYPELVVPSTWTDQESYIKVLRSYPICIATTGLHGSIGWKLSEYTAFSKAIVSEKLLYEVPGEFAPGRNYLEFATPQECVGAAEKLIADKALRGELMRNNASYYQQYVRPDSLVLNALKIALR